MFGINLVFDRDRDPNDATGQRVSPVYSAAAVELGATTFRYPGGTVSERLFDLADPFSGNQNHSSPVGTYDAFDPDGAGPIQPGTLSLSGALNFAQANNLAMTFVMPTYRFLGATRDSNGNRREAVDTDLISSFVKRLLLEAHGRGVKIEAIELGNEWHVNNSATFGTTMSAIEYGRIASRLAAVVQSAITDFRSEMSLSASWSEPSIVVQVGPGGRAENFTNFGRPIDATYNGPIVSATELIFREFNRLPEQKAIDGLVTHRYLTGDPESATGWAYRPFDTFERLAQQSSSFGELERFVTEWNVQGRNKDELGLRQAGNVLVLFTELLNASVDHANVWAVQQNNSARLTINAGFSSETYQGLSPTGELFRLLSTNLQGAYFAPTINTDATSSTYVFANTSSTFVYVVNNIETTQHFSFETSQFSYLLQHAYITILGVANGDYENLRALPELRVISSPDLILDGFLEFDLQPYQVAQISLTRAGAEPVIFGSDGDDGLFGSSHSDYILGSDGNDFLEGFDGGDKITGDAGSDSLFGGLGMDFLSGGIGIDYLYGGDGDDAVNGGDSFDVLIGGEGSDTLAGGEGDDVINGGSGNDLLYGGPGFDYLDGGGGLDTLSSGEGGGRMVGGTGADVIYCGTGVDVLVFKIGDGADRVLQFETGVDTLILNGFGLTKLDDLLTMARTFGSGVLINLGNGDTVMLEGVSLSAFIEDVVF